MTEVMVNGADDVYGAGVPFPLVGALIASRQPRNPIGWLLCASGLLQSLNLLGTAYGEYAFITHPGSLPAAFAITWLGSWAWMPSLALVVTFFPLLFPDGHLLTPRWRWAGRTAAAGVGLLVLGAGWAAAASSGVVLARGLMGGPAIAGVLVVAGLVAVLVASVASVWSLIVRFRRSRGEEREQMKWVAFAGTFAFVTIAFQFVPSTGPEFIGLGLQALQALGLLSLPVAAGIAILKYRLYDIDVVINKAVVFGALAAFITLLYVGIVVGVGRVIGSGGRASPGLSILATAIVAIGFQPARERVQRFANRLVYGKRATPYEVMANFARRMSGTIDVGQSLPSIAQAAALGVGGSAGTVRLLLPGGRERVETWPQGSPASASPTRAVEVRYQGDPIGEISVTKDPGDPLRPAPPPSAGPSCTPPTRTRRQGSARASPVAWPKTWPHLIDRGTGRTEPPRPEGPPREARPAGARRARLRAGLKGRGRAAVRSRKHPGSIRRIDPRTNAVVCR